MTRTVNRDKQYNSWSSKANLAMGLKIRWW